MNEKERLEKLKVLSRDELIDLVMDLAEQVECVDEYIRAACGDVRLDQIHRLPLEIILSMCSPCVRLVCRKFAQFRTVDPHVIVRSDRSLAATFLSRLQTQRLTVDCIKLSELTFLVKSCPPSLRHLRLLNVSSFKMVADLVQAVPSSSLLFASLRSLSLSLVTSRSPHQHERPSHQTVRPLTQLLGKLTSLQTLELNGLPFEWHYTRSRPIGPEFFALFPGAAMQSLTSLTFDCHGFLFLKPEHCALLPNLLSMSLIRVLFTKDLENLKQFTNLKSLLLTGYAQPLVRLISSTSNTASSLPIAGGPISSPTATTTTTTTTTGGGVHNGPIHPDIRPVTGPEICLVLSQMTRLRSLSLDLTNLYQEKMFTPVLVELTGLENLDLRVGSELVEPAFLLPSVLQQLTALTCAQPFSQPPHAQVLARLSPQLRRLELMVNIDQAVGALPPQVKELHLNHGKSYFRSPDSCNTVLDELQCSQTWLPLRLLGTHRWILNDDLVGRIVSFAPALTRFSAFGSSLTNQSVATIAAGLPQLQCLALTSSHITDYSPLVSLPRLIELRCWRIEVADDGPLPLHGLDRLTQLRFLFLDHPAPGRQLDLVRRHLHATVVLTGQANELQLLAEPSFPIYGKWKSPEFYVSL